MAGLSGSRGLLLLALKQAPAINDALLQSCSSSLVTQRWATKKAGGSTKNTRDSHPKHLGTKMGAGQLIYPGQIIVRQRGTRFHPGTNVCMGKDHTLHATAVGFVKFSEETFLRHNIFRRRRYAHVLPQNEHWELDTTVDQDTMVATKAAAKQVLARFHKTTS